MSRRSRKTRTPRLRLETLEARLNPGTFTVNDSGNDHDDKPDDGKPLTAGGKVTLQAVYDHIHQKGHGGEHTIKFDGPMTVSLGHDFYYGAGKLTVVGIPGKDGPDVKFDGFGLTLFGSGGKVQDVQITNAPGYGVIIKDGGTVQNCVVSGCGDGILLQGANNKVKGCRIGTTPDGSGPLPNRNGVTVFGSNNVIGGTDPADRNIISGNTQHGVRVFSSSGPYKSVGTKVLGNYIGLSKKGDAAVPNGMYGVYVQGDSSLIGGTKDAERNVIVSARGGSGPAGEGGVYIDGGSNNKVLGNYIGTKPDGDGMFSTPDAPPEPQVGVRVIADNSSGTLVSKNVVADYSVGIRVSRLQDGSRMSGLKVTGNKVGVGKSGTAKLRNYDGLELANTDGAVVGGTGDEDRNVFSGNAHVGIRLTDGATHTKVQGNYVGTNKDGADLGNGVNGILIDQGTDNFIGTPSVTGQVQEGYANEIAFNGDEDLLEENERGHGVEVNDGTGNTIRGNRFHDNLGLSIHLNSGSFDGSPVPQHLPENDVGFAGGTAGGSDFDGGGNDGQNHPVYKYTPKETGVPVWELNGQANGTFTIDVYRDPNPGKLGYGEGQEWVATYRLKTDKNGYGELPLPAYPPSAGVVMTATDMRGNTSTFGILDTDGDGLADAWETGGIDYDMDGTPDATLTGASPSVRDVFVEADYVPGVFGGVDMEAVAAGVHGAFRNAPGGPIELHVEWDVLGEDVASYDTPADYARARNNGFASKAGGDVARKAYAMAYRYAAFVRKTTDNGRGVGGVTEGTDGTARYPADTSLVGVSADFWTDLFGVSPGLRDYQAAFMHELGHALGLGHGGTDDVNYKPNYHSVMNYTWAYPGIMAADLKLGLPSADTDRYYNSWRLDYSRGPLNDVNENQTGPFDIGGDPALRVPVARAYETAVFGKVLGFGGPFLESPWRLVPMGGSVPRIEPGRALASGRVDLNGDGRLTVLKGAEDWSHLQLNHREGPAYGTSYGQPDHGAPLDRPGGPHGPRAADPVVVGAGPGSEPRVRTYDPDGSLGLDFLAFDPSFTGGVRVAKGDVNGDQVPDVIAGMATGGGQVKVFDGRDGTQLLTTFTPFGDAPTFVGGVSVAAGDLNGDGKADVVVARASGVGGDVKVLSGLDGSELKTLQAQPATFNKGLSVAVGDVDGDGKLDVIVAPASGAGPSVKVIGYARGTTIRTIAASSPAFTNGVSVAAGDVDGDGKADLIVGAGPGTTANGVAEVHIYSGAKGTLLKKFVADDPAFRGGVRVAALKRVDGSVEVVTGTGPGKKALVRRIDPGPVAEDWFVQPFDDATAGAFVA